MKDLKDFFKKIFARHAAPATELRQDAPPAPQVDHAAAPVPGAPMAPAPQQANPAWVPGKAPGDGAPRQAMPAARSIGARDPARDSDATRADNPYDPIPSEHTADNPYDPIPSQRGADEALESTSGQQASNPVSNPMHVREPANPYGTPIPAPSPVGVGGDGPKPGDAVALGGYSQPDPDDGSSARLGGYSQPDVGRSTTPAPNLPSRGTETLASGRGAPGPAIARKDFVLKSVGTEYQSRDPEDPDPAKRVVDETSAQGWRVKKPDDGESETVKQVRALRSRAAATKVTEGRWSDDKRTANTLKIDAEDGSASTSGNGALQSTSKGYVLDPTTGNVVLFNEMDKGERRLTADEVKVAQDCLAQVLDLERSIDVAITDEQRAAGRDRAKAASERDSFVQMRAVSDDKDYVAKLDKWIGDCDRILSDCDQRLTGPTRQAVIELVEIEAAKAELQKAIGSQTVVVQTHHSSPLGGEAPVAGAGKVSFELLGRISMIDNVSGHFRPGFVQLAQTIEHLIAQGAMLDKELTYINDQGAIEPLSNDAELSRVYAEYQGKLPGLQELRSQVAACVRAIDEAKADLAEVRSVTTGIDASRIQQIENNIQGLNEQYNRIRDQLKKFEDENRATFETVRKHGIGPANRSDDAEVGFIEDAKIKNLTGMQVKGQTVAKMPVEEFLSTGGAMPLRTKDESGQVVPSQRTVADAKKDVLVDVRLAAKLAELGIGKPAPAIAVPDDLPPLESAATCGEKAQRVQDALPADAARRAASEAKNLDAAAVKLKLLRDQEALKAWKQLPIDAKKRVVLGELTLDEAAAGLEGAPASVGGAQPAEGQRGDGAPGYDEILETGPARRVAKAPVPDGYSEIEPPSPEDPDAADSDSEDHLVVASRSGGYVEVGAPQGSDPSDASDDDASGAQAS